MKSAGFRLAIMLLLILAIGGQRWVLAQPTNNNCPTNQPIIIPPSGTICINTSSLSATSSNATTTCNATIVNEVWFSFVANGPVNTITVTPNGGTPIQQPVIRVSDGLCSANTFNTCNAATTALGTATVNWAYPTGATVNINVAGILGDGTFELCITSESPPPTPGSTCAGATPTCNPSPFTLNSMAGNLSSGIAPSCFNILGTPQIVQNDVWYVFSVGQSGTLEFTVNVNGIAELDWAVFDISLGCPGTEVVCNYNYSDGNSGSLGLGLPAGGEFNAPINVTAGNTYAIMIDNFDNNGVGFDFTWGGTFQMAPTADFIVNTPTACNTLTTTFANNTVGAASYLWNFGNGATSTAQTPPAQTYTTAGTSFVTLTATSGAGCTNSFSVPVEVFSDPTLSFTVTDESCPNLSNGQITVAASGSGPFVYAWPGGGNTATETSLCANDYSVTVTDQSTTCSSTQTATVASGNSGANATINPAVPPEPYCLLDAAIQLTATDPGGIWSGNGVDATGLFLPANAGVGMHTITYTIAPPCGSVGTIDLEVLADDDPTINPPNSTTLCENEPALQLTSVNPGGLWTGNGVSGTGLFNPTTAGIGAHTIFYTTAGMCPATDQIQLTVTASINANINPINGTNTFCLNALNVQLTATNEGGNWSGNGISVTGNFDPAAAGIGTHTITYTIPNPCGDVQTIDIEVFSITFANTITDASCFNGSDGEILIENETGSAPHLFSIDGATATQNTGFFQGLAPGNFTLIVEDADGCISQSVPITVSQPAVIVLSTSLDQPSSCGTTDGQVSVVASGGTVANNYLYSWNSTPVQTTAAATELAPATYTVSVTDDNGCVQTASAEVTETAGFVINIIAFSDASCFQICDATATVTTGNGAVLPVTYLWSNGQTTAAASGFCAGNQMVTVIDDVGCTATESITISEPTEVTTQPTADTSPICIGQSSVLTSMASGGTPPYSVFSWSASPVDVSLTDVADPTVLPLVSTVYSVVATDANGCTSTVNNVFIDVLLPLTLSVIQPAAIDTSICLNDAATFNLQATGGDGNFNYHLFPNANTPINLPFTVQPTATTVYNFSVSDGCTTPPANTSSTVTVFPLPQVNFEGDLLSGCHPHTVTFTDLTSATPVSWNWDFGDPDANANSSVQTNPGNLFSGPGIFDITLTVISEEGCVAELTRPNYVEVFPAPDANFSLDPTNTEILNSRISFSDLSAGDISVWNWDFGDGNFSEEQNPTHVYLDTGAITILLQVITENECEDTISNQVVVNPILTFWVPNAFTPNSDRINPTFRAYGEGFDLNNFQMFVYNRWGQQIFFSSDIKIGWNGTYNNTEVEEGTYTWRILIADFNGRVFPHNGHITLTR